MKHGSHCNCMMCSAGKAVGMIKKPKNENGRPCTCGSGKNYEDCCGQGQNQSQQ